MLRTAAALTLASLLAACGGDTKAVAKTDVKTEVKKDAPVADAAKTPAPPAAAKTEFKPDEAWTTLSTMSNCARSGQIAASSSVPSDALLARTALEASRDAADCPGVGDGLVMFAAAIQTVSESQ